MIDPRQIRAARALLNWSQADLAEAARMATSSVKNIENEAAVPRRDTLLQIKATFEAHGVEFLAGCGTRLRSRIVDVHDDRRATETLLNSIYTTAHASERREVMILGLDERYTRETDGSELRRRHVDRLREAGIAERILIAEGDTHFINEARAYRWLPREYFARNAPVYVYGNKVAFHTGSLRRRTVIIDAAPIADQMRKVFSLVWDRASEEPRGNEG